MIIQLVAIVFNSEIKPVAPIRTIKRLETLALVALMDPVKLLLRFNKSHTIEGPAPMDHDAINRLVRL